MELAKYVAENLQKYERPHAPERPKLGWSDGQLLMVLSRRSGGRALTTDEKATMQLFGAWRFAVMQVELDSMMRLVSLIEAVHTAEKAGHEARRIREFVFKQWGRVLPSPLLPKLKNYRAFAELAACESQLLPRWMRTGDPGDAPPDVRGEMAKARRTASSGTKRLSKEEAYADDE